MQRTSVDQMKIASYTSPYSQPILENSLNIDQFKYEPLSCPNKNQATPTSQYTMNKTQSDISSQAQTKKIFNFYPETLENKQSVKENIGKNILLIQTLCQTYNRDRIFASSILKLAGEMKQELKNIDSQETTQNLNSQMLLEKVHKFEKKKRYYKTMCRSLKQELSSFKQQNDLNLLKSKDQYIEQLQNQINELGMELNNIKLKSEFYILTNGSHGRQHSIGSNMDFQDLVKECDKFLYENQPVSEQKSNGLSELINETIQAIKINGRTHDLFMKYFSKNELFCSRNFKQVLYFIQDLTKNQTSFISGRQDFSQEKEILTLETLKDMREKLLKDITEQLDAKVQQRFTQTLNHTNSQSDFTNKSQITKEDLQKEILQVMKDQQLAQQNSSQQQQQFASPKKQSPQKKGQGESPQDKSKLQVKPSIRQKQQSIYSKVSKGTDTKLDKSDLSNSLQRSRKGNQFLVGADGEAATYSKILDQQKTSVLSEKIKQAEQKFRQISQQEQTKPTQSLFQEELEFDPADTLLDDDMLLSDLEESKRQSTTFGTKQNNFEQTQNLFLKNEDQQQQQQKQKPQTDLQKSQTVVCTYHSQGNQKPNTDRINEKKPSITPKQGIPNYNRFGFKSNRSGQSPSPQQK